MKQNVLTFSRLKLYTLAIVLIACISVKVNAQAVVPFGCNGSYYVTYGSGADQSNSTSIDKITYDGSAVTASFVGTATGYGFNGSDINPIDGFMYGIRYSNGLNVNLLKIDANVNVTDMGVLPTSVTSVENVFSGCFDSNGDYYVGNVAPAGQTSSIYKINVATADAVLVGSTGITPEAGGQLFFVDIAIDPTTGIMYGATNFCCGETGAASQSLYTIDKTTGAATKIAQFHNEWGYKTTGYGLFFTANGNLFLYGTDTRFYLVNKSTAEISSVGNGSSYAFADACGCSYRINHLLQASASAICLPNQQSTTAFSFTETFINNRGTSISGAGYYLALDKRFSFTQTEAEIKLMLEVLGIATDATVVTFSDLDGGIKNVIDISPVTVPYSGPGTSVNFILNTTYTNTLGPLIVDVASKIYNLPTLLGEVELSDDPATLAPADSTTIVICDNGPLPVTFISINASTSAQDKVYVQWEIANQVNVAKYKVERSVDGINYIAVGEVKAANISSYSFADNGAAFLSGKVFYRIVSVDMTGEEKSSKIVSATVGKKETFVAMSPNPFRDNVKLKLTSDKAQTALINIYGADGRLYQSHKLVVSKGISENVLQNTDKLSVGTYSVIIKLSETGEVFIRKMIKN